MARKLLSGVGTQIVWLCHSVMLIGGKWGKAWTLLAGE
jgi:hypothetical protein